VKSARFTSAAISADATMVAGGTRDGRLLVARRDGGGAASAVPLRSTAILAVAFSPDGARLAVATAEPELFIYDVATLLR
jgi:tricorn protease-like protein